MFWPFSKVTMHALNIVKRLIARFIRLIARFIVRSPVGERGDCQRAEEPPGGALFTNAIPAIRPLPTQPPTTTTAETAAAEAEGVIGAARRAPIPAAPRSGLCQAPT